MSTTPIQADSAMAAIERLAQCLRQEIPVASQIVIAGTPFRTSDFLERAASQIRGPAPSRLMGEIGLPDGSMVEAVVSLAGRLKQQGLLQ